MEEVVELSESLQRAPKNLLTITMDYDQPVAKNLFLDETRVELADDTINFLGLREPKKLNFLNFSEVVQDFIFPQSMVDIEILLSQRSQFKSASSMISQ